MQIVKQTKTLDILEKGVPSVVTNYFWATTEIMGNDLVYNASCVLDEDEYDYTIEDDCGYLEKAWRARMKRLEILNTRHEGDLLTNPISGVEAFKQTVAWLKDQGVTEEDRFYVSISW